MSVIARRASGVEPWIPRAMGSASDLQGRVLFPKPACLIELVSPDGFWLGLTDRRLLNVLLHMSWSGICNADHTEEFQESALVIRDAIGRRMSHGNELLRASLDHLQRMLVPLVPRGASEATRTAVFLSVKEVPVGSSVVMWDIPLQVRTHIRQAMVNNQGYGMIDLGICRDLSTCLSLIMYENLALRSRLRDASWSVSIAELRRRFGCVDSFPRVSRFWDEIIVPALTEVNAVAPFVATVEVEKKVRKSYDLVRFVIRQKPGPSPQG